MTIAELVASEIKRIRRQWRCQHYFVVKRELSGYRAANVGYNQILECRKCGKLKYKKSSGHI